MQARPVRRLGYLPGWQAFLASRRLGATGFRPEDWGPSPPLPSKRRLRREFHEARQAGARVILLRGGHGAAELDETQAQARYLGFASYWDYVAEACQLAAGISGPGGRRLLPALEFSPVFQKDLIRLAPLADHFRFNLDAVDEELLRRPAFENFPDKRPEEQARSLEAFLKARVRVAAVTMVGVGERPESRRRALEMLADFRAEGGHLASVSITPFVPSARAPMRGEPMAAAADVLEAVRLARELLPADVIVSLQPEGRDDLLEAVRQGAADDIGFVTLNRPLPHGATEGAWFESRLGRAHRFRGEAIREESAIWTERESTGPWSAARGSLRQPLPRDAKA